MNLGGYQSFDILPTLLSLKKGVHYGELRLSSPQNSLLHDVTAKMHTFWLMITYSILVSCGNYEFHICIVLYFYYAWWNGNKFQPYFISRHVLKVI